MVREIEIVETDGKSRKIARVSMFYFLNFQEQKSLIALKNAYLHMFAQRWWMCVGFVAAIHPTIVWFVGCVYVGVLLAVRWVGEPPVASFVLTFEWFLAWNNGKK